MEVAIADLQAWGAQLDMIVTEDEETSVWVQAPPDVIAAMRRTLTAAASCVLVFF